MMAVDQFTLTATIAADGTASVTSNRGYQGAVLAVYLDYTSAGAGCDVTLTNGTPAQTILVKANNQTDGWFYPVVQMHTAGDGAAVTGQYSGLPLFGAVTLAIAQGTEAGIVAATIVYYKPSK